MQFGEETVNASPTQSSVTASPRAEEPPWVLSFSTHISAYIAGTAPLINWFHTHKRCLCEWDSFADASAYYRAWQSRIAKKLKDIGGVNTLDTKDRTALQRFFEDLLAVEEASSAAKRESLAVVTGVLNSGKTSSTIIDHITPQPNKARLRYTPTIIGNVGSPRKTRSSKKLRTASPQTAAEPSRKLPESHQIPSQPSASASAFAPEAPSVDTNFTRTDPLESQENCGISLRMLEPAYATLVDSMARSTIAETAQSGRHLQDFMAWHIADVRLLGLPTEDLLDQSIPCIDGQSFRALGELQLLSEYRTALATLSTDGQVKSSPTTWWGVLFGSPQRDVIPAEIVISVILGLAAQTSLCGSMPMIEASSKMLACRIIQDSAFFCAPSLVIRHEYVHQFNETASDGSGRSDMAVTAVAGRMSVGILIVEFEKNVTPTHKDYLVAAAEAVLELRKLVAFCNDMSMLKTFRIHIAYVAGETIEFNVIFAVSRSGGVFWGIDRGGPVFNLSAGSTKQRLLEGLMLVDYLRRVVFPDGIRIENFMRRATQGSWDISRQVPPLAKAAPKSRETHGHFTPHKKRKRDH
ncbi:hypothetical protein DFJ77DRAFT_461081 [Powellomyces hirtus]|nr:hypothetical protein DFJ77DRAFT_461081 [Powellomyces hirtus]